MSQAQVLYDLQKIDTAINNGKKRLGEVLRLQREPAEVVAARQKIGELEKELNQWRREHQNLTLEIASLNDKAKREEERLYSGTVKNTKELTDLQQEVESLGRRRASMEDESLVLMERVEAGENNKQAADSELAALVSEWEAASVTLKEEQHKLAVRLNQLLVKRDRQAQLAQPNLLNMYEQLQKQKNGVAVAVLKDGKCQRCLVTVSASTARAVDEGKLVYCDSCGRILCAV